jgi:hypothetical protein
MIADVVNFVIVGMGFCRAAGGPILWKGLAAGVNRVISEDWVTQRHRYRARILFALTKDF